MTQQFVIIGGGFFGCAIALHLRRLGFERVMLVERESALLTRASYCNQARVHNGYHYPRSLLTASRSRINLPRFRRDYGFAVKTDFTSLYAIASRRSKVIPRQFERFMDDIGATHESVGAGYAGLFDPAQIAAVYLTEEYAFDALKLRSHFESELAAARVRVELNTDARRIVRAGASIQVELCRRDLRWREETEAVINCSYASLNRNVANPAGLTPIKHEITEVALIDPPRQLAKLAVTVMDGPFFSCMPFPAEDCHSLTHVRYTPQGSFIDCDGSRDPVRELEELKPRSRVAFMIADGARLMPCLREARWRRSLFEIKSVLVRNEADDGRPVLLRREALHPQVFSLLGAKIDNIYDVLTRLELVLSPAGQTRPAPIAAER
jgi:glycine/D-amino acid oxidase-like deaminating enzyme